MELETFFTASQQTQLFLWSCIMGVPLGILYDIFRVIRIIFPHGKVTVAVEDILFCLIYSVSLMMFTLVTARGEFRFFYVIGNFLGFVLYFATVGNLLTSVLRKIAYVIKKVLCKIFNLIRNKVKKLTEHIPIKNKIKKNTEKKHKIHLIDNLIVLYNSKKESFQKGSERNGIVKK